MLKNLYLLALLALLFAACGTNDVEPELQPDETALLTFTYIGSPAATRTVSALPTESIIYDMSIFVFRVADGSLAARLTADTDYTQTTDETAHTTTLSLTRSFLAQYAGETLQFYFVANDMASKGGSHTADLDLNTLTASQLENKLTATLPDEDGQSDSMEELDLYLYDEGVLMTAKSSPIRLAGKHEETIKLVRRVARFDLYNLNPDIYRLKEIYISAAPLAGALFGTGQAVSVPGVKGYTPISGPTASEYDTDHLFKGAFYLYPTTLSEGNTEIVVRVQRITDNPVTTAYCRVKGTTAIQANKRYILKFNEADLTFTVGNSTGDWQNGN